MKIIITSNSFTVPTPITIEIGPLKSAEVDHPKLLDWIFRQFNRGRGDDELIDILQLNVPSLSVGDTVEIDGRIHRCEFVGWREI